MFETKRVAYHEAAHAVSASKYGLEYHGAAIFFSDGEVAGLTHGAGKYWDLEGARTTLVYLYAGYAAAARLDPQFKSQARAGAGDDFEKADNILPVIGETKEEPYIQRAHELVEANWAAISVIAAELLCYMTLDLCEIELLIAIAEGDATAISRLVAYRALCGKEPWR